MNILKFSGSCIRLQWQLVGPPSSSPFTGIHHLQLKFQSHLFFSCNQLFSIHVLSPIPLLSNTSHIVHGVDTNLQYCPISVGSLNWAQHQRNLEMPVTQIVQKHLMAKSKYCTYFYYHKLYIFLLP